MYMYARSVIILYRWLSQYFKRKAVKFRSAMIELLWRQLPNHSILSMHFTSLLFSLTFLFSIHELKQGKKWQLSYFPSLNSASKRKAKKEFSCHYITESTCVQLAGLEENVKVYTFLRPNHRIFKLCVKGSCFILKHTPFNTKLERDKQDILCIFLF